MQGAVDATWQVLIEVVAYLHIVIGCGELLLLRSLEQGGCRTALVHRLLLLLLLLLLSLYEVLLVKWVNLDRLIVYYDTDVRIKSSLTLLGLHILLGGR